MSSKTSSGLTPETAKEKILAKLRRAGRRGAPRGGLGFTATAPYATLESLENALTELEKDGSIIQVFTRPTPRFFTSEDAPKTDRVAEKIAARATLKSGRLLSITDLEKALTVVEKPLAEKAAARLVEQSRLVRLRYQARDLYTDAEGLRDGLSIVPTPKPEEAPPSAPKPLVPKKKAKATPSEKAPSSKAKRKVPPTTGLDLFGLFGESEDSASPEPFSEAPATPAPTPTAAPKPAPKAQSEPDDIPESDAAAVEEAYLRLVAQTGFPDVEIAELANEGGFPLDAFKEFLIEENANGRAVFSLGDWSLASESTRSGAVLLRDETYLLVRFPGQ